jgi:hypothetical protein
MCLSWFLDRSEHLYGFNQFLPRIGLCQSWESCLGEHDVLVVSGQHEALGFYFYAGDVGVGGGYF